MELIGINHSLSCFQPAAQEGIVEKKEKSQTVSGTFRGCTIPEPRIDVRFLSRIIGIKKQSGYIWRGRWKVKSD
jgi:hypothetical protein